MTLTLFSPTQYTVAILTIFALNAFADEPAATPEQASPEQASINTVALVKKPKKAMGDGPDSQSMANIPSYQNVEAVAAIEANSNDIRFVVEAGGSYQSDRIRGQTSIRYLEMHIKASVPTDAIAHPSRYSTSQNTYDVEITPLRTFDADAYDRTHTLYGHTFLPIRLQSNESLMVKQDYRIATGGFYYSEDNADTFTVGLFFRPIISAALEALGYSNQIFKMPDGTEKNESSLFIEHVATETLALQYRPASHSYFYRLTLLGGEFTANAAPWDNNGEVYSKFEIRGNHVRAFIKGGIRHSQHKIPNFTENSASNSYIQAGARVDF